MKETKSMFIFSIIFFGVLFFAEVALAATYYVDASGSNTAPYDTWAKAAAQINTIFSNYILSPGDAIYVYGTFASQNTIGIPSGQHGNNVHPGNNSNKTSEVQNVSVAGSTATFSTTPSGVSANTDYVWIVNSFKGNSGTFKVTGVNGANITVDTSNLPGGTFLAENSSDSLWTLKGAIIRPVRLIGGSVKASPSGCAQEGYATIQNSSGILGINAADYLYISYLDVKNDTGVAIRIRGNNTVGSDFVCLDHVKIENYGYIGLLISGGEYGTGGGTNYGTSQYYPVIQHCYFGHQITSQTQCNTKEHFYYGRDLIYQQTPNYYEWNGSISYNEFANAVGDLSSGSGSGHCSGGDGRSETDGDSLDTKSNDRYSVIWGNYFHDSQRPPAFGILKGINGEMVIANNYFENVHDSISGWGILTMTSDPGSNPSYVFGNIFYNNYGSSIGLHNAVTNPTVRVYNNTFYGRKSNDSAVYFGWPGNFHLGYFYNNMIQNYAVGINVGYAGGTVDNDGNNFFYGNTQNFNGWTPKGTYYITDPGLNNPVIQDFTLKSNASAIDKGTNLSSYFTVDNHNAATPGIIVGTQPIIRSGVWDIGAYEYVSGRGDTTPPAPPTGLRLQ